MEADVSRVIFRLTAFVLMWNQREGAGDGFDGDIIDLFFQFLDIEPPCCK